MGTGNHISGGSDLLSAVMVWVEPGHQHKDLRRTLLQKRQTAQSDIYYKWKSAYVWGMSDIACSGAEKV